MGDVSAYEINEDGTIGVAVPIVDKDVCVSIGVYLKDKANNGKFLLGCVDTISVLQRS